MHRKGGQMRWMGGGKHAYLSSHDEDLGAPFFVPDFIEEGREKAKKRHPAQKPEALCDRLVHWFVEPGDVVMAISGSGNSPNGIFQRIVPALRSMAFSVPHGGVMAG